MRECDRLRLPSGEFLALRSFSDAIEDDHFGLKTSWSPVVLLLVWQAEPPSQDWNPTRSVYSGLILRERGENIYSRLGEFDFIPDFSFYEDVHPETKDEWRARFPFQLSWFDDCEEKVITLV